MADDDELNLDDNVGGSAPAKKNRAGGLFSGLLKWIIIAISAIIVIVVVVVVVAAVVITIIVLRRKMRIR